jgi:single-strand DNA-binding protein
MQVTIIGNLVEQPTLEFTNNGTGYVRFRVAENKRYQDRQGEWKETTSFWTCKLWREQAENMAGSLNKGNRVIIIGDAEQRSWETPEGDKRSTYEVSVNEIGPSLRWATASVERTPSNGNGNGNYSGGGGRAAQPAPVPHAGPAADDPYAVDDQPF